MIIWPGSCRLMMICPGSALIYLSMPSWWSFFEEFCRIIKLTRAMSGLCMQDKANKNGLQGHRIGHCQIPSLDLDLNLQTCRRGQPCCWPWILVTSGLYAGMSGIHIDNGSDDSMGDSTVNQARVNQETYQTRVGTYLQTKKRGNIQSLKL